jgi:hypothetical protein
VQLTWEPPPGDNLPWNDATQIAVLRAHPDDLWRYIGARVPALPEAPDQSALMALFAPYPASASMLEARSRHDSFTPPTQTELRVLQVLIGRQLIGAVQAGAQPGGTMDRVRAAHAVAQLLGYEVVLLPNGDGPTQPVALLHERGAERRGWGALAVRLGEAGAYALEVPRSCNSATGWVGPSPLGSRTTS